MSRAPWMQRLAPALLLITAIVGLAVAFIVGLEIILRVANVPAYTFPLPSDIGYAVFGKVVKGMDIVEKIGQVPTTTQNGMGDVPKEPVVILSIRKKDDKK